MEATYQLNSSELPKIVKGLSLDEPFKTLGQKMTFHRGGVKVAYHSVENPEEPESIRSWGTIDLKDLSMKYRDKYQPFQNLTGAIEFKAAGIQLKNIQGWYGDSAMQLQGAVSFPVGAETRYNLHLTSAAFKRSDFKGIPFLQTLELSGAPKVDLRLNGSEKKFSFQNQIDLTDTAYQYGNTFSKLKGAPNNLKLRGNFSKTKGLVFGSIEYGLGGNKVTGSGQIKSFRDPSYSIHFKADDFLAHPAAQFIVPLKYSEAGAMSFDIRGSGNLNRLEDSMFDGTLKLKNLAMRLENYSTLWY
jgi:hypothetical protein